MGTTRMILVHGKECYVVIARLNEEGQVVVTRQQPIFQEGDKNSTTGNVMAVLAKLLNKIEFVEEKDYNPENPLCFKVGEMIDIATIGSVADKINSDFLVKEFRAGRKLSKQDPRPFLPEEMNIYRAVIKGIKKNYGDIVIVGESHVSQSVKPGQTVDQMEWGNIMTSGKGYLDNLLRPAPTLVGNTFNENEPDDEDLAM